MPRVTTCCGLLSLLPMTVTTHLYGPLCLTLKVTVTSVTSSVSGIDAFTESSSPFSTNCGCCTTLDTVYCELFKLFPFTSHFTIVGGPKEELKISVNTGGSASREDMRVSFMLESTTGPAVSNNVNDTLTKIVISLYYNTYHSYHILLLYTHPLSVCE